MWASLDPKTYPADIPPRRRGAALFTYSLPPTARLSWSVPLLNLGPASLLGTGWWPVITCWQINVLSFPRTTLLGCNIVYRVFVSKSNSSATQGLVWWRALPPGNRFLYPLAPSSVGDTVPRELCYIAC